MAESSTTIKQVAKRAGVSPSTVSHVFSGVDTVDETMRDRVRDAVSHLIGLNHQRIALINGPEHLDVPRERQTGYEQAFQAAELQIDPQLIVYSDFHETGGYRAMRELLELPAPPTAVFIANNLMALGALQSIYEKQLRIPADISVVCFDDLPWLRSFHPPLTAVAQPIYEIGTVAANLMLERLRDPLRPVHHIVLPTKFVVRFSCRQLE